MVDTISASELKQALDQFVIIDVREQDELGNGTIDGSTHMPLGLAIRNVKQGKIDELKQAFHFHFPLFHKDQSVPLSSHNIVHMPCTELSH